jgi:OOP family OmpA-OmpF porin
MRSGLFSQILVSPFFVISLLAQITDVAGSSDPFLFKRVPGFRISEFRDDSSASVSLKTSASGETPLEGHKLSINYRNDGATISPQSVLQHYKRIALGLGGKLLTETPQSATYFISGKSTEIWLAVDVVDSTQYKLIALERGVVVPEITAEDMVATLQRQGRVALYPKFKPDEATILPESHDVIAKAAKALQQVPAQRINVEGHTDFIGNPQDNKALSLARAKAVADAFIALGVDPKRLTVAGYGQERPLADNTTEEGRAKNRRIELVNPGVVMAPVPVTVTAHPKDAKGAHDHPLFPRMPGYYLLQSDLQDSADVLFAVGKPGESTNVTVHGRRLDVVYRFDDLGASPMPGAEQILRNYTDAARRAGGTVEYESSSAAVVKVGSSAGEVWARIGAAGGEQYTLTVVGQ